jgi:hypothetical protein
VSELSHSEVREIVAYCSEEVRRQGRGPLEVGHMVEAWLDALRVAEIRQFPFYNDIEAWGRTVEPEANDNGYRTGQVYVGDHIPPKASEVPRLMVRFVEWLPSMEADDAYLEFERIHPFMDGNGRVGKIIYNLRAGCLPSPIWPPNFWGISNP